MRWMGELSVLKCLFRVGPSRVSVSGGLEHWVLVEEFGATLDVRVDFCVV